LKLNKLLNTSKINKKLQSVIKQYDYETSAMVGNVLGSYRERELARKEVFGEPQLLEFENLQISCHANPDEYLTKIYGDYMQLPKEAERKGGCCGRLAGAGGEGASLLSSLFKASHC